MRKDIFSTKKGKYIVKGQRECIFRKLGEEFLLFVYKDHTVKDYRDEANNEENELTQGGLVYCLNQSATIVWYLLKDNPTPESLLNTVLVYYPQQESQNAKRDLGDFLYKLWTLNLIDFSSRVPSESVSTFLTGFDDEEIERGVFEKLKDYSPMQIEAVEVKEPVAFGITLKSPSIPPGQNSPFPEVGCIWCEGCIC